jgi:hypothetical protein
LLPGRFWAALTNEGARAGGDWDAQSTWCIFGRIKYISSFDCEPRRRPKAQTINNAASVVGLYDDLCHQEYPMLRCVRADEGWKFFVFVAAENGSSLLGAQRQQRTSSIIILLVGVGDADADEEEPCEVALAL